MLTVAAFVAAIAFGSARAEEPNVATPAPKKPDGPAVVNLPSLSQKAAEKIVEAAEKKAKELDSGVYKGQKTKMHVYVLGREGTVLASTQANGAWPGSADIAQRKARTAWLFKLPTRLIGELSRVDKEAKAPLYGIEISNTGLITFPGGLPIFDENKQFIGSIGVSGDTVDLDEEVAKAGVEKAKSEGKDAVVQVPTLTQHGAALALHAAVQKAAVTESGVYAPAKTKMHVYVLGREGTVLAASQADDAWPGSADIAQRKARTSWLFKLPTDVIGDLSRLDKEAKAPLYGIELSNSGLITFPGGLPIFDDAGEFVGSIGVSGDTVGKDKEVAQAGVDALKGKLPAAKKEAKKDE
jgi:uncharacterized protein GlcG (DUF336 family)